MVTVERPSCYWKFKVSKVLTFDFEMVTHFNSFHFYFIHECHEISVMVD